MTDLSRAAYQGGMDHIAALQAKIAKQRSEIARLTQALEKATAEKAALLDDLKWMRGER